MNELVKRLLSYEWPNDIEWQEGRDEAGEPFIDLLHCHPQDLLDAGGEEVLDECQVEEVRLVFQDEREFHPETLRDQATRDMAFALNEAMADHIAQAFAQRMPGMFRAEHWR